MGGCQGASVGERLREAYVEGVDRFGEGECRSLGIEGLDCGKVSHLLADGIVDGKEHGELRRAGLSAEDVRNFMSAFGSGSSRALMERAKWLSDNCTREKRFFGLFGYNASERRTMIAQLGQTVPEKSEMAALLEASGDDDAGVRNAATKAFERLVSIDPFLVVEFLEMWVSLGSKLAINMGMSLDVSGLARGAETNRRVVRALDRLIQAGNKSAIDTLGEVAETNPDAVQLLTGLARGGNESAINALTKAARTNPDALTAFSTLAFPDGFSDSVDKRVKERKSAIVEATIKSLDVSEFAKRARTDPGAVDALALLAEEGNEGASQAMRSLDVSELAGRAKAGVRVAHALGVLATAGNESAIDTLGEVVETNPNAVQWLTGLARGGNESAIRALAKAARTNLSAMDKLGELAQSLRWKRRGTGILGRESPKAATIKSTIKSLDAKQFIEVAKKEPEGVMLLENLADAGNKSARAAMRSLDVNDLVWRARFEKNAGRTAPTRSYLALTELAKRGNESAKAALLKLK